MVQLVSVVVPYPACRPPPLQPGPGAALPVMVQLVSVVLLWSNVRPPPLPDAPVAVLPLMVQLVSVVEPPKTPAIPPAIRAAELPLTVQLVSVSVVPRPITPPPFLAEVLPLTVQLVSVSVPFRLKRPPPRLLAGVVAELPLTVQLVSVTFPPSLYRPPPLSVVVPPLIVSPDIDAVTPPSIWNTRLAPPASTVTPFSGPTIASVPVVSLSSSWPSVGLRVIVWGALNTVLSNVIVSFPPFVFARAIAWRRSIWPTTGVSVGLFTTMVDSSLRSSSAIKVGRIRRRCRGSTVPGLRLRGSLTRFLRMVLCSFGVESPLVEKNGSHAVTNGTRGTPPFPADPAAPGVGSAGPRSDAGTSASAA